MKATKLIIDASHEFDMLTRTLTLTGNGTVFTPTGTFTPSTGTVDFTSAATSGTTIPATTYNNLTLNKLEKEISYIRGKNAK